MMDNILFSAINIPAWVEGLKYIDLGILVLFLFFGVFVVLFRDFVPRIGAVAWVTAKEALFQPLFVVLVLVGLFALFIFLLIPYNTFGEDIKLVKTQGLTIVTLIAAFFGVWSASSTVTDEIDGRTALMTLAKPISRRDFICGKYAGVMIAATMVFLILGSFFLNTVSYKLVHDAREAAADVPTSIECAFAVYNVLPALVLAYFQMIILTAIAIAISTRLPILPNLTIILTIYLVGNFIPDIVQSSVGQIAMVAFVADVASAILPSLGHFNSDTSIVLDQSWSWNYVRLSAIYVVLYCCLALVISLLLFENRDLA
ncbi:MAG: ABC transporter permease subunit [Planctomycetaceae bacterium]|jgi:ABC-type transport system involved in multi-copper enzyme maturation permease subunit|nr:ABC transporter permease subunit [Planctomycetaceae bacterium]